MALSVATREAMMRNSTDRTPVYIFRVSVPVTDPAYLYDPGSWPLRFTDHPTSVVSNGYTYDPAPNVQTRPPDDEEEGEADFILILPGTGQDLIDLLRLVETAPTLEADLLTLDGSTTQDTVDFEWRGLTVREVEARDTVEFHCQYENLIDSPYPQYRYSASLYPGLR